MTNKDNNLISSSDSLDDKSTHDMKYDASLRKAIKLARAAYPTSPAQQKIEDERKLKLLQVKNILERLHRLQQQTKAPFEA